MGNRINVGTDFDLKVMTVIS